MIYLESTMDNNIDLIKQLLKNLISQILNKVKILKPKQWIGIFFIFILFFSFFYFGIFKESLMESDITVCKKELQSIEDVRIVDFIDNEKCSWGRDILKFNIIDEDGDKIGAYCLSSNFSAVTLAKTEGNINCKNYDDYFSKASKAFGNGEGYINFSKVLNNILSGEDVFFKKQAEIDEEKEIKEKLRDANTFAKHIEVMLCSPDTAMCVYDVNDSEKYSFYDRKSKDFVSLGIRVNYSDGCPRSKMYEIDSRIVKIREQKKTISLLSNKSDVKLTPIEDSLYSICDMRQVDESFMTNCEATRYLSDGYKKVFPIFYEKISSFNQGYISYTQKLCIPGVSLYYLSDEAPLEEASKENFKYNFFDPTVKTCDQLKSFIEDAQKEGPNENGGYEQFFVITEDGKIEKR